MLLFDVTQKFDSAIKVVCKKRNLESLIPFVKDHERRTLVLTNLCDQVIRFERQFGRKANAKRLNEIIASVAYNFLRFVKAKRDEDLLSTAQKNHYIAPDTEEIEKHMIPIRDREIALGAADKEEECIN